MLGPMTRGSHEGVLLIATTSVCIRKKGNETHGTQPFNWNENLLAVQVEKILKKRKGSRQQHEGYDLVVVILKKLFLVEICLINLII
jgi:hypothetical protein